MEVIAGRMHRRSRWFKRAFSKLAWTMAILLAVTSFTGCAARLRVASVSQTFLEGVDSGSKLATLPYQHSWVAPGFDFGNFKLIYLKPIRVDLLPSGAWEASRSFLIDSDAAYQAEARALADYFHQQLVAKIQAYPEARIHVSERPAAGSLTVEIAITELQFSHPVSRTASMAVPVPGTGALLSAVADPHVAFAARFSTESGALQATIADRKFPPTRIIDFSKLTVTSSAREVCASWATMLAETFNKGVTEHTESRGGFSMLPW